MTPCKYEERRIFKRFELTKNAFYLSSNDIGLLKNISLGGIATCKLDHSNQAPCEIDDMEIFLPVSSITIPKKNISLVYSSGTDNKAGSWVSTSHFKFVALSQYQVRELWDLIRTNYSTSQIEPTNTHHDQHVSFLRQTENITAHGHTSKRPKRMSHFSDILTDRLHSHPHNMLTGEF